MYHIAIVEDEAEFRIQLQEYLQQYQRENDVQFKITTYADGAEILEDYQQLYEMDYLLLE